MPNWEQYINLHESGKHKEALLELEKYAMQGDISAMFCLGQDYGVYSYKSVTDYNRAAYWFEKASNEGDLTSRYEYGVALLLGMGIDVSIEKGKALIISAAKGGNELALGAALGQVLNLHKFDFKLTEIQHKSFLDLFNNSRNQ